MLPASLLAAASLANSLEVYGKDVWPAIVQQYSAYTLADLAKARQQIKAVRFQSTPTFMAGFAAEYIQAYGILCKVNIRSRVSAMHKTISSAQLHMAGQHRRHMSRAFRRKHSIMH